MSRDTGELIDGIDPEMIEQEQTTDHPIPDEVMREAEKVLRVYDIPPNPINAETIARALLAERQRAAAIAETMAPVELSSWSSSASPKKVWRHSAMLQSDRIAAAILAQGDKP